jgi:prepilin-type N-terminal cleavage/methylation domain-containing protein
VRNFRKKFGFTLIEVIVVITITTVLIGLVIGIAGRIDTQNKERLLRGTFAQLDTALQAFAEYEYRYRYKILGQIEGQDNFDFYNSLDYPPDCSGFEVGDLKRIIGLLLGADNVVINPSWVNDPEDEVENIYSSSAAMYFFLNQVPESRSVLNKINPEFLTNKDKFGNEINIYIVTGLRERAYPLTFVLDPWKNPLHYNYYSSERPAFWLPSRGPMWGTVVSDRSLTYIKSFPVITSAGPDGEFGTGDDIKSR